jgi:hypothetical protein
MTVANVSNRCHYLQNSFVDASKNKTQEDTFSNQQQIKEDKSCDALAKAIENKESIFFQSKSKWYKNNWIVALFRRIFRKNEPLLTAQQLTKYLSKPNVVNGEKFQGYAPFSALTQQQIDRLVRAVKKALASQLEQEDIYLKEVQKNRGILANEESFSKAELVEFDRESFDKKHFKAHFAFAELEQARISSFYLGKEQQSITSTVSAKADVEWLKNQLKEWQARTFPDVDYFKGSYSEPTRRKLERCCKYKEFIEAAKSNPILVNLLFLSIFRNSAKDSVDAVDMFIQTPQITKELHRSYIDTKLKKIKNKGLKFRELIDNKTGKRIKDVTLLIGGKEQSISDPSHMVKISEKTQMTVKRLFDTFKDGLDGGFIPYEYLQDTGITEFDGRCKGIDITKWRELPVVERMTPKDILEEYGTKCPKDKEHGLFVLRASRKNPGLYASDTHAWVDILLPLEDGSFNCISVGKFSTDFPVGQWETFKFIRYAHPAEMTIIDPNKFYNVREKAHFVFPPMNLERLDRCMKKIQQFRKDCDEKKEYFEGQGRNCAAFIEELTKDVFPDFKLDLFNTKFSEVIAPPFTALIHLGNFVRICLSIVLLGALKGVEFVNKDGSKKIVRLINNPDWREGILKLPGSICEKDRAEEIRNEIAQLPRDKDTAVEENETLPDQSEFIEETKSGKIRLTPSEKENEYAVQNSPQTVVVEG